MCTDVESKRDARLTEDGLCFSAKKLLKGGRGKITKNFNNRKGPGRR